MGLSASQARLLTITARKSDCEFESMRLSHQKIALSRDMEKISAEYDTAMTQTKLVYDYYGTGSQQTPLTYNLMMTPSQLNNYTPIIVSDSSGRVVLDDRLAKAAKDAGIPQEGLDGLPSSDLRNAFIDSLMGTGYISQVQADNIKKTTYNQAAGVGSSDLVNVNTTTGTLQDLIDRVSGSYYDFSELCNGSREDGQWGLNMYDNGVDIGTGGKISLADLLEGNYSIRGIFDQFSDPYKHWAVVDNVATSSFWEDMFTQFETLLNTGDEYTQAALNYARRMTVDMIECLSDTANVPDAEEDTSNYGYYRKLGSSGWLSGGNSAPKIRRRLNEQVDSHIGIVYIQNEGNAKKFNDGYGINLSNMVKAYLTYFAQYMEGIDTSSYKVDDNENYNSGKSEDGRTVADSNLIDDMFQFTIVTDVDTSGDNLLVAAFWDTLFNQICTKGWVENTNVNDQEYLQESFKNGNMYISTLSEDGYYYQGNYATNTFIKEVTDEEGIAQAEARYAREKAKINNKENILDMKMKNLDTEISSLSTEYDTIKNVLSKNIEKSFKRFQA